LSWKLEVDSDPNKPCDKAAEVNPTAFENSDTFAGNCEIPLVEVRERSGERTTPRGDGE
jgi:hypothetical protein